MIFLPRRRKEDVRLAAVDSLEGKEASVVHEVDEELEFSTTSRKDGYFRRLKIRREAERTPSSSSGIYFHRRGCLRRRKENARRYRFPFAVDEEMASWDFLWCGEMETIVD